MAELEGVKDELVYLRLWLLFALGVGGMIVLGMGIYMLYRHIERRIREIRSL